MSNLDFMRRPSLWMSSVYVAVTVELVLIVDFGLDGFELKHALLKLESAEF